MKKLIIGVSALTIFLLSNLVYSFDKYIDITDTYSYIENGITHKETCTISGLASRNDMHCVTTYELDGKSIKEIWGDRSTGSKSNRDLKWELFEDVYINGIKQ